LQAECGDLVCTEPDVFGRQAMLERNTYAAWQALCAAAASAGVVLQLVSAYRSVAYQTLLIERKLARGDDIARILTVNAAPGYSEHHTGRALDIGTPGFALLEEAFERSAAFAWLRTHAGAFGFRLSFPRDNPHGVMYEPWHWYYSGTGTTLAQMDETEGWAR
jgi:D-alanyl-D-alanine carboxypeptidase